MSPAASFVSTVPLALVGLTTAAVTAAATVFYVAGGARGRGSGGSGAETAPTVASPTPDDLQQQLHHPLSLPSTQAKAQGADVLSLSALSSLIATHTSYTLHEAAVQLLLDRAMTTDYLSSLLRPLTLLVLLSRSAESESSQPHPTPDLLILVKQSLAAVQQLTKQESNKRILIRHGLLKSLVKALYTIEDDPAAQRYAVVSLFRLVSGNDKLKRRIVLKYGALDRLVFFLANAPTHNNDLKYWSLLLLHQFSLTESLHPQLVDAGCISLLTRMTRLTFGNTNMQKLCMHSLVRIISSLESEDAVRHLKDMLDLGMVSMIASSLKNDDLELVSWSVFLMHEFVIKDVARPQFCNVRGILKMLVGFIGNEDSCLPRIVLRSIKCLGIRNEQFQREMVKEGVVKKAVFCLRSADEETRYWALAVLNELIALGGGTGHNHDENDSNDDFESTDPHAAFFESKGLSRLIELCCDDQDRPAVHVLLYAADIMVYLCGESRNHQYIVKSHILRAVMALTVSSHPDAQYAGAALMLTLSTMSRSMVDRMVTSGAVEQLASLMFDEGETQAVQSVAAKTILTIAKKSPALRAHIVNSIIMPLMAKIAVFVPICIKSLFPRGFSDDGGAADVSLTSSSSTSAAAAAGADGSVSGSSQKLVELRPRSAASLRSNSPIRVKEDGEEVFDPYSPGLSPPPMSSRVGRYRQDLPIPSSPEDRASQRHQFQTHHQLETRTASSSTIVSSPSAARIPGENYFTQNLPLVHADGPIGIIPIEELTTPVGVRSSMSTADSEIQYINQSNDNGSAGGVATGSSDGMGLRLAISANEQETAGSPLAFYNYADSPMMAPGRYGTTTLPAGHRGGAPMTTPTSTTDDNNLQLQQQQHTSNPTSTISRPQFPRGNVPLAIEEEDEDAATSTVTSGEPTTSTAPPAHNPHSSGSSDGGAPSSPIPIVHHSHNSTLPPSSASPDNTFSSASMMMFGLDQDGMPEKIATKLTGLIDCLYILLHSDIFDSVHVESGGKLRTSNRMIIQSLDELLGEQLSHLVFSLLDILVLPLVGNEEEKEQVMANKDQSVASPLKGSFPPLSPQSTSPSAGLKKELSQPRSASPKFSSPSVALAAADALLAEIRQIAAETGDVHLDGSPTFDHHGVTGVAIKDPIVSTPTEIAAKRATELKTIKDMIAVHATTLVGVLIKYDCVKKQLLQEKIFTIFVALIQERRPELLEQAVVTSALCTAKGIPKTSYLHVPFVFTSFLRIAIIDNTPLTSFYAEFFLEYAADHSSPPSKASVATKNQLYARLNLSDKTPSLMILPSGTEMRNDGWAFESIRCNYGIPVGQGGKFAYEVSMKTDGIIQIGWATIDCEFDPEGGTGIGDDGFSYAYDGHRCKKWHGLSPKNNNYGDAWSAGDTITTVVDMSAGEIEYFRNGISMGVAFRQVNRAAIWYPAISLASNQGCRVRFGDLIDPILYLPDDCHPIAVLAWKRSNNPTTTATTAIQPSLQRRNSIAESVTSSATGSQLFVDANSDFATSDDGDDLPSYNNNNNNHHLPVPESATAHILEQLSPASSVSNDNPLYQLQARGPSSDGNGGGGGGESSPQNPTSSVIIKDTSPITTPVVPEGITFADKIAVSPLGSVLSETASTLSPNSHDSMTESPAGANASPISINSSSSPQSTGSNSPGKKELVSRFGSVVSPLYTDDESGFTLSFYYEVRIGLRGDEGKSPQVGLYDRQENVYLLQFAHGRCYMLHVVLDGEEHDFWDQYLGLYLEAGAPSTHYNTVVQDVQDLGPVKLEEGDVVGVGLCLKEQMVVFSHNGRLLSRRLVGEVKQRLHFPFTRNLSRSIVNIGQRAFYFNKGNTDLISIISYLERP